MDREEIFKNVVFKGKRRYYVEDLTVRDYTLESTTPYQLYLLGNVIEETKWGELLRTVSIRLLEMFPEYLDHITNFRCPWTNQEMYSKEQRTNYKPLKDGLFINVNLTALHLCWFLQDVLDYFKIDRSTVKFLIHRPSGAEPEEVKAYILDKSKKEFAACMKEKKQLTDQVTQSMIKMIEEHLNPLLCTISKSYTNFFLFDDNTAMYNYVKRAKERIEARGYEERHKRILFFVLDCVVEYYKSQKDFTQ